MAKKNGYLMFDADSHMYEPVDVFSSYIDPEFAEQAVRVFRDDHGGQIIVIPDERVLTIGGDQSPIDHAIKPGHLRQYLRAIEVEDEDEDELFEDMRPDWVGPEARMEKLDEQGVEASFIFPSVAIALESYFADKRVMYANLRAFNRWIDEHWSFNFKDRMFIPPLIPLADVDAAVAELDWALERGAKVISLRTGPAYGRSPGDPHFDPFWARVNEAGLIVTYHITESGYNEMLGVHFGHQAFPHAYRQTAWQWTNCYGDRAIMDTLSALVFDNLFGRFPNIKVVSVEHGAEWVPYLLRRMDKMRGMARRARWIGGPLEERPSAIFKRHCFVVPYPEDNVPALVEELGDDFILAGSDYPHGEGLAEPATFADRLKGLPEASVRKIMRDNGMDLMKLK